MTSSSDLETAYERNIAAASPITSAPQANDAFEVYTFSLVLRAAREEGATVTFQTVNSTSNPTNIIFRSSPGRIYSTTRDYCHAVLSFPDDLLFEAHIGVYVEGLAGVIHECDVLVIQESEGTFCRNNNVHPKKKSMVLSAECKFYTKNLGISLGREFLGMTLDLGKEDRFFLSNSDGNTLDRVLAHHKRQRFLGLTPQDADSEIQTISLFRTSFRNHIAKHRR